MSNYDAKRLLKDLKDLYVEDADPRDEQAIKLIQNYLNEAFNNGCVWQAEHQ